MFNHGLTAATLFWFVGLLEQRSGGLRGLDDFGGLRKVAPVFCGLDGHRAVLVARPAGLNGFVGEFLIFKGVFPLATWAAALSAIGLLVTAVFILTILQRVFNGPLNATWSKMPDLTLRERVARAAGHRADVRAGRLPATGARRDQQHRGADGEGTDILTMLAWTIYISFLGAAVLMLLPKGNAPRGAHRRVADGGARASSSRWRAPCRPSRGSLQTIAKVPWIPSLGIEYHLAADGISLTLVLLTGLAAVAGILFSWNIEHRAKEFFAFYLALIGGVYGVFLSFDLFLLLRLLRAGHHPEVFPHRHLGLDAQGIRRDEAGALFVRRQRDGAHRPDRGLCGRRGQDDERARTGAGSRSRTSFQMWAFPLVFVGFGILAGLWPFHTWAPTGHVAAPTAASMLLAGVVMKLGAYGCLRVAMTLFPQGWTPGASRCSGFGSWRDVLSVLAVIGIVYGAMVALVQKDFKFVIGYSSVSHMGFVLLGLLTLNTIGLSGAVLQMFSHGIIAGLLFAVVGRMVYDRTHTRELADCRA